MDARHRGVHPGFVDLRDPGVAVVNYALASSVLAREARTFIMLHVAALLTGMMAFNVFAEGAVLVETCCLCSFSVVR